jgi:hypothetical protein
MLGNSLRTFYRQNNDMTSAVAVDREVYDMLGDTDSAVKLAASLIDAGQVDEAAIVSAKITEDRPDVNIIKKIVALHSGSGADAIKIPAPEMVDSYEQLIMLARIEVLSGNSANAVAIIAKAMERTPHKLQSSARKLIWSAADFKEIAGTDAFKKALATASKMKKDCGDCGRCPSQNQCNKQEK